MGLHAASNTRWGGWALAAGAALFAQCARRACHVQQVLALRGATSETTEASRGTELLKQAFRTPFADYVGIVVHGPVRWTHPRFAAVPRTPNPPGGRRSPPGQVIFLPSLRAVRAPGPGPPPPVPSAAAPPPP